MMHWHDCNILRWQRSLCKFLEMMQLQKYNELKKIAMMKKFWNKSANSHHAWCMPNIKKSTSIIFKHIRGENWGRFFKLNYSYNQTQRMKWIHRMINCTMRVFRIHPFLSHIIHSTSSSSLSSSSQVCIMVYGENLCMST